MFDVCYNWDKAYKYEESRTIRNTFNLKGLENLSCQQSNILDIKSNTFLEGVEAFDSSFYNSTGVISNVRNLFQIIHILI